MSRTTKPITSGSHIWHSRLCLRWIHAFFISLFSSTTINYVVVPNHDFHILSILHKLCKLARIMQISKSCALNLPPGSQSPNSTLFICFQVFKLSKHGNTKPITSRSHIWHCHLWLQSMWHYLVWFTNINKCFYCALDAKRIFRKKQINLKTWSTNLV